MSTNNETTDRFQFFGDYANETAYDAWEQGFAEVAGEFERMNFPFFGGATSGGTKTPYTVVVVNKPGFTAPGPSGPVEVEVGTKGRFPKVWMKPPKK